MTPFFPEWECCTTFCYISWNRDDYLVMYVRKGGKFPSYIPRKVLVEVQLHASWLLLYEGNTHIKYIIIFISIEKLLTVFKYNTHSVGDKEFNLTN